MSGVSHHLLWDAMTKNDQKTIMSTIESLSTDDLLVRVINPRTDRPLLHECASHGYLDLVKRLIQDKKIPVDSKDTCGHGLTALHMASREGKAAVVRYLVQDAGANVNEQDRDGYTALHYASVNGSMEVVSFLISCPHINVNLVDYQNRTALHRAIEHNKSAVAHELIIKANINVNIQNNHGWSALHYASYQGNRNLCTMLLNHGADTSLKDRDGKQPLFWGYGTWQDDEKGGCTCPKPHR